jgi:type II secretion system protein N
MNSNDQNPMNIELPQNSIPTPRSRAIRTSGWIFFGLFSLLFFTLIKLPDDRIRSNIDQAIGAALSQRDLSFTAGSTKLSAFFGLSYSLKDVTFAMRGIPIQGHIDRIQISPSLLPLLFGKIGGSLSLSEGSGSLDATFSIKNSTTVSVSFTSKKMDLGKIGILPIFANFQGSATLDGSGELSGDLNSPNTLEGRVALNLKKIVVDPQSILGFSIPRLGVSEAVAEIQIAKAKASISNFRLGKTGAIPLANSEDDLQGIFTGELNLAKDWNTSNLNVKARFSLSETIMKAFILLDAILGSGKQSDGSYSFAITGSPLSPLPMPVGAGGSNF